MTLNRVLPQEKNVKPTFFKLIFPILTGLLNASFINKNVQKDMVKAIWRFGRASFVQAFKDHTLLDWVLYNRYRTRNIAITVATNYARTERIAYYDVIKFRKSASQDYEDHKVFIEQFHPDNPRYPRSDLPDDYLNLNRDGSPRSPPNRRRRRGPSTSPSPRGGGGGGGNNSKRKPPGNGSQSQSKGGGGGNTSKGAGNNNSKSNRSTSKSKAGSSKQAKKQQQTEQQQSTGGGKSKSSSNNNNNSKAKKNSKETIPMKVIRSTSVPRNKERQESLNDMFQTQHSLRDNVVSPIANGHQHGGGKRTTVVSSTPVKQAGTAAARKKLTPAEQLEADQLEMLIHVSTRTGGPVNWKGRQASKEELIEEYRRLTGQDPPAGEWYK